ncbi:phosphoglycerate kinase [candidate division KSB3 bacterium]|uniref:Phosphoglycerate kinase n=1 Tax=candidate division KSB3 bacterium TaxID=2044937 RepID=A0A9D5JWW3_9BACT|nr:phosphoglycerate kinase [candidate division KSB3 bacterium]MBD3325461.1 phosphoglycerate kinase [candidate division KSB3 bacterium]
MGTHTSLKIRSLEEYDYQGKTVILRVDINSPIDPQTKKIVNENRINMSLPTIQYLLDHGAKVAMIAHQGDTLDYQNLIALEEHAEKLTQKLGRKIGYIDDVAGPAAQYAVKNLQPGEAILLGNLRYLTEEVSTFENAVKLTAPEMLNTYLIRHLAPLADYYINDAFAAAHRNAPSMVAFQELLPSAAGFLFFNEVSALSRVLEDPDRPAVFILGGAKISDAYGMMKQVLSNGTADKILACGVTGIVMLKAKGYDIGKEAEQFLADRSLEAFLEPSQEYLREYPENILLPVDLAYEQNGTRAEIDIDELPRQALFADIGAKTIVQFKEEIRNAGTLFVNGPPGMYENALFEDGTREVLTAIAAADGYSVIGGGDSVSATHKYVDPQQIDYICTAGGAMVRFLSGKKLPLIAAMEKAYAKP